MCLSVGEWVCVCLTYISEWMHFHSRALWTPHGNMKFEDCPLVDGSNDSIIMQWVDAMICAHFFESPTYIPRYSRYRSKQDDLLRY